MKRLRWEKKWRFCHNLFVIARRALQSWQSTALPAMRKGGRNFMRSKIPEPCPEVSIAVLAKQRFACNAQERREFYA